MIFTICLTYLKKKNTAQAVTIYFPMGLIYDIYNRVKLKEHQPEVK